LPPRNGPTCRQRMPLNSFSLIVTFAGLGEAADRTETGKIEIAKMSPNNATTRCLGEFIRLQCKGYAFIQLELHAQTRIWRIFLGSTGCQPVSFRQLAEKPTTQLMLRFVKMSSASSLGAPEFALWLLFEAQSAAFAVGPI